MVVLVPANDDDLVVLRLIEADDVSWRGIDDPRLFTAMRRAGRRV